MTSATVDMTVAAAQDWDAIVIGAGPAGAIAARELTRAGRKVLLVDQASFPRWKVCGACINRRGLAILEAVGLEAAMTTLGAISTDRLCLHAHGVEVTLPLTGGAAVSRSAFDAYLVDAAIQSGTAFLPSTTAQIGDCTSDRRAVKLRQSGTIAFGAARIVLVASGLKSQVFAHIPEFQVRTVSHSRMGAGVVLPAATDGYPAGLIHMAIARHGYVGLVRVETGELNVAAAFDVPYVRRCGGVGEAAEAVLAAAQVQPVPGLATQTWRGTPLLTSHTSPRALTRVLVIGDAAGYVEPFSGEGMSWALVAGVAVVPIALRAMTAWNPELESHWERQFCSLIGRKQRICRFLAAVLKHPLLSQVMLRLLARLPGLAAPLLHEAQAPVTIASRRFDFGRAVN